MNIFKNTKSSIPEATPKEETADAVSSVEVAEKISSVEIVENEPEKKVEKKPRKTVVVSRMGSDHIFGNINNQDFAFYLPVGVKFVADGCGSGKHSEVGSKLFGQLFAQKVMNLYAEGETLTEENFTAAVDDVFSILLTASMDPRFIFNNYCFTILCCVEHEDEFVVFSSGDGYIITEDESGISYIKLDDGEYPAYYVYNFVEDKSKLAAYQSGVSFQIRSFPKDTFTNVGVASDGLRYVEELFDEEKFKLRRYLHEGKGPQIEMLINRNNREEKVKILDEQGNQIRSIITKSQKLHDDISIVF